jgi:hypothetical protein
MKGRLKLAVAVSVVACATAVGTVAVAGGGRDISEELSGYEEVPAISTGASGKFQATVRSDRIEYKLSYAGIEGGNVSQAHIHFGQRAVNGGISVFLCTNIGGAPANTDGAQPCPSPAGEVTGTLTAADVIGPAGQGIAPREFGELLRAIKAGVTYANVHSAPSYPGGEIRAQLENGQDEDEGGEEDDD